MRFHDLAERIAIVDLEHERGEHDAPEGLQELLCVAQSLGVEAGLARIEDADDRPVALREAQRLAEASRRGSLPRSSGPR